MGFWEQHPELVDLAKSLADQGLSASQIADQIGGGITRNSVVGIGYRQKFHFHGKGTHNPRLKAARKVRCEAVTEPQAAGMLTIDELLPTSCRWIDLDVRDPNHRYCGQKQIAWPWCEKHHMMACQPR